MIDLEGQGNPAVLHPHKMDVICLGLYDGEEAVIIPRRVLGVPEHLKRTHEADEIMFPALWDALAQCLLIGHNIGFDTTVMGYWLKGGINPLPTHRDTMAMAYALWPATKRQELSLSKLVERHFGWADWSMSDYSNMWAYSEDELFTYCIKDVVGTWHLHELLSARLAQTDGPRNVVEKILMPFIEMTTYVEPEGVTFDRRYVEEELIPAYTKQQAHHLAEAQRLADRFEPEGGWPKRKDEENSKPRKPKYIKAFNPGSPKQVAHVLASAGFEVKGTSVKALEEIKHLPFVQHLLGYRDCVKSLGTYLNGALTRCDESEHPYDNDRIFPSYNGFDTITGRLSSSGPNIQNQPKKDMFRRMYVAKTPGRLIVQSDYSQAELRVMAAVAQDAYLLGIFADETVDFFDMLMPSAFPTLNITRDHPDYESYRGYLKRVIYGLMYGRGAKAIALELKVSVELAQGIMDNFLSAAHSLADWREDVKRTIHSGRVLTTRYGRYFQQDLITNRNNAMVERSALSFTPQSSASDTCLLAAIQLHRWIRAEGRDWTFQALVHDAINLDVPEAEAEEASQVCTRIMSEVGQRHFPEVRWAADSKIGPSWAKKH